MNQVRYLFHSTLNSPDKTLLWLGPHIHPRVHKCEVNLQMGIFFDGTRNNLDQDVGNCAHSNVARLYKSYIVDEDKGIHSIYIPGVGTLFSDVDCDAPEIMGSATGDGGEERILFAILQLMNTIYKSSKHEVFFSDSKIDDLLSGVEGSIVSNESTTKSLVKLECITSKNTDPDPVCDALKDPYRNKFPAEIRENFLKNTSANIARLLKDARPRVMEVHLDVFGFSRGAAQARVFCNWLNRVMSGGKFCGVNVRIRFLGIFDTVASVGLQGHANWAKKEYLTLPKMVENCVHMVAMHELRSHFPLDSIRTSAATNNPQWVEVAYPGSHSDVGGGYAPGEMGVAMPPDVEKKRNSDAALQKYDAHKLSQIPLLHMYECAKRVHVPLDIGKAKSNDGSDYNPFITSPETIKAYKDFIVEIGVRGKELHEWAQNYVNWKYRMRETQYSKTSLLLPLSLSSQYIYSYVHPHSEQERKASFNDRMLFIQAHICLGNYDVLHSAIKKKPLCTNRYDDRYIHKMAADSPLVSRGVARFFDRYVHDSYAGFILPNGHEKVPYLRARKIFAGDDTPFNQ